MIAAHYSLVWGSLRLAPIIHVNFNHVWAGHYPVIPQHAHYFSPGSALTLYGVINECV